MCSEPNIFMKTNFFPASVQWKKNKKNFMYWLGSFHCPDGSQLASGAPDSPCFCYFSWVFSALKFPFDSNLYNMGLFFCLYINTYIEGKKRN